MALHLRAKTSRRSTIVLIMSLLLVIGVIGAAGASAAKSDVCHYDADMDTYHLINISDNAYDKHIEHGDAAPGEAVPTMPGFTFDDNCGIPPRMVADGASATELSEGLLSVAFTVYQATSGEYSGTGTYNYEGTGNDLSMPLSNACLNETAGHATVWGLGTLNGTPGTYAVLTLKKVGDSMSTRALFLATEAAAISKFDTQCSSGAVGASGGTGFLTFS